ncbi:MAG: polyprenyl synthetase family protein [Myxococcota bacterium]
MSSSNLIETVRKTVTSRLESFLEEKRCEVLQTAPASAELVDELAAITLRGGKRIRAVIMAAGFQAVSEGALSVIAQEAASVELLQSYLLIHDDWMDCDLERRGGPAAHASLGSRYGTHLGAALAILCGDLGATLAWELHLGAPFSASARPQADQTFLQMQKQVYMGQHLDLVCYQDVRLMQQLKTGSYTVRGPLRLGALLGNANENQLNALERWAAPVGLAFQLKDDLLGTFGDSRAMGKPVGNDLRQGKRTSLIAAFEAAASPGDLRRVRQVLESEVTNDDALHEVRALLESSGAKDRVTAELERCLEEAYALLEGADLRLAGIEAMQEITRQVGNRAH